MNLQHINCIYVDGAWVSSASPATIPVVNPATEAVIGEVPAGSVDDVKRAATAARGALEPWSKYSPLQRAALLRRAGEILQVRADELAATTSAEVGTPLALSRQIHVEGALATLIGAVQLAETYQWEEVLDGVTIVRAPVGVVAAITPWNLPLGLSVDKIVPAMLSGCSVILKPSEVAPMSAWALAEAMDEAGVPPGVFNLVSGDGPTVGEALVVHPDVDMVSFTGSTRAGKRIASLTAEKVTRLVLEMGGKSANILLDDADLDAALPASVKACFQNSGQVCAALTRLLVPRTRHDDIAGRVKQLADGLVVGDPRSDVELGPLVSAAQRDRVLAYIRSGIDAGATLVTGGLEAPDGVDQGYFVRPTVFADVDNSMRIAQEEIFGPVLTIIPYDDEVDAVRIANDSPYGLSGGIWSADVARAGAVARKLRTGTVRVNGKRLTASAPFGGFKQSGFGRAHGAFGIDEYVELQAITGLAV